jgi:GTP cyclohydrolase II
VSDLSARLGTILNDDFHLAADRAVAELRAGRPLLLETQDRIWLAAALDGASPSLFEIFRGMEDAVLVLTPPRARIMGLAAERGAALSLKEMDFAAAAHLASGAPARVSQAWREADADIIGGVDLCKKALLLPALLAAPVDAAQTLPGGLHRHRLTHEGHEATSLFDLEIVSQARVPLAGVIEGRFLVLRGGPAPRDQVAIVIGDPDPAQPVPVRVHSACLTGDLFGSLRCDCGDQLKNAVAQLAAEGGGVLVYLDQEGRGIGIANKMRAYALQNEGFDTIDADAVLGFGADERRYEYAASVLVRLGYRRIILLTNNPEKIGALTKAGIEVVERRSVFGRLTAQNEGYLNTKAVRARHLLQDLLDRGEATGTDD